MNTFFYYVATITLLDCIGTIMAKFYFLTKNPLLLIGTTILFGIAGLTFALSLKYEGMAITNVLWISFSILAVTLFGYFFFKENISAIQLIGIFVILIGLILICLK